MNFCSTITRDQETAIALKVSKMTVPSGLGSKHNACSIAAINLALNGRLSDETPDCMSCVVANWILLCQDAMPASMRNSEQWKSLLPYAAGTGRKREQERLEIVLNWLFSVVLPSMQPIADKYGIGAEWLSVIREKTVAAAEAVRLAERRGPVGGSLRNALRKQIQALESLLHNVEYARLKRIQAAGAMADAKEAAASELTAETAIELESRAWTKKEFERSAAFAFEEESEAQAWASSNAASLAATTSSRKMWRKFDPCDLLQALIEVRL